MAKKGGLGRGLDILFQDTGAGGGDEGVSTLRLAEIEPDKNQPRKAFDDTALSELAAVLQSTAFCSQSWCVRPPQGDISL